MEQEKVLVHDNSPGEVHLIDGDFISADHAVCGQRLHPICSVHITNDEIPVTCKKCKEFVIT